MESEIWRVRTEKIGSLEPFKSESDMESFLMNNPAIVGCWDPESEVAMPSLIREQISTLTEEQGRGRMDLVGIARTDKGYELRLFELKAFEITESAVDQLDSYLKGWEKEKSAKSKIQQWVLNLHLDDVDETNVYKIINNPVGILVGPKFQPEAISKASKLKIRGIRLARFRSEAKSEYYVIIEDQVGTIVSSTKKYWSWRELINAGLIQPSDSFYISFEENKLVAKPDPEYLDYNWIRVIFDEVSKKELLEREKEIKRKAENDVYAKKWLDKALSSIKIGEGVWLTHATGLCYLAFEGPTASYWNPSGYWIHEKSGKSIYELKDELFVKNK
jgi:hypothetical protein